MTTKFYTFTQNNSFGRFEVDEESGINEHVIIEAIGCEHANLKAQEIGLYFNGCDYGMDCHCCGDRWYEVDESDGEDEPKIYGTPVSEYDQYYERGSSVHFIDGTFKNYKTKAK
jgi:hypothetical protein